MCINLRDNYKEPYNPSNIRWKYAEIVDGKIISPYRSYKYEINKQLNAKKDKKLDVGFHVFVSKNACIRDAHAYYGKLDGIVFLKCEMSNFHCSGEFEMENSEVWKSMKIVQVLSGGKRDITKKFIKS